MYEAASSVSPDLELAIKKSTLLAKAKLADRINCKMNNQSSINKTEVGIDEDNNINSSAEDTIVNIINNREVIPELLQNECNAKEIYKSVVYFLKNPDLAKIQVDDCMKTLYQIRSKSSSSDEAAKILSKYLVA